MVCILQVLRDSRSIRTQAVLLDNRHRTQQVLRDSRNMISILQALRGRRSMDHSKYILTLQRKIRYIATIRGLPQRVEAV